MEIKKRYPPQAPASSYAHATPLLTFDGAQKLVEQDSELHVALAKVETIDFGNLRLAFIVGKKWTREAVEEAQLLYQKFLALCMRFPGRVICPTGPIDEFWHVHICDTRAYARDCDILFGKFLHHYPYFGLRGPEDRADLERALAASIDLFIQYFGIDPSAGDTSARSCRPQRCHAAIERAPNANTT